MESMTEHDEAGASESIMGQDGTGAKEVTGLSTRNITGMEADVYKRQLKISAAR